MPRRQKEPTEPKQRKPRKPPRKKVAPSKTFATKIANGSASFLAPSGAIDGRSLPARRFRELSADIASDLGGADQLSTIQQALIRRFVGCCVVSELAEAKIVSGGDVDVATYSTLANTSNRLASTLGVRRVPRDVTPTLEQYLASRAQEAAETGEEPDADEERGDNA